MGENPIREYFLVTKFENRYYLIFGRSHVFIKSRKGGGPKEKIGYAIPKWLTSKHKIIVGNATTVLQKLFEKISSVDIFIHDSSHTYQNMINEFRIVWPKIKKGGFLISDDISENDAFLEFSDDVSITPIIVKKDGGGHFGIIMK